MGFMKTAHIVVTVSVPEAIFEGPAIAEHLTARRFFTGVEKLVGSTLWVQTIQAKTNLGAYAAWGNLASEDRSARSSRSRKFFSVIQIADEIYLDEEVFDGNENS